MRERECVCEREKAIEIDRNRENGELDRKIEIISERDYYKTREERERKRERERER